MCPVVPNAPDDDDRGTNVKTVKAIEKRAQSGDKIGNPDMICIYINGYGIHIIDGAGSGQK